MWWEKNEKPEVGLELGKPACGVPTRLVRAGSRGWLGYGITIPYPGYGIALAIYIYIYIYTVLL
jgi:hypothetical protein